ncbi:hypothetical protein BT63DRAFT_450661 [Microthyrium microscopicum]|uniref:Uncharacterized protein n=1 Tax=Microthyrium microscopicum TaxID=703497 RepID=A0A6A6ULI2_9PEZI|nr:hypothetical protein BT63DRAFT_450661 [Microthyrium microscopicum]
MTVPKAVVMPASSSTEESSPAKLSQKTSPKDITGTSDFPAPVFSQPNPQPNQRRRRNIHTSQQHLLVNSCPNPNNQHLRHPRLPKTLSPGAGHQGQPITSLTVDATGAETF